MAQGFAGQNSPGVLAFQSYAFLENYFIMFGGIQDTHVIENTCYNGNMYTFDVLCGSWTTVQPITNSAEPKLHIPRFLLAHHDPQQLLLTNICFQVGSRYGDPERHDHCCRRKHRGCQGRYYCIHTVPELVLGSDINRRLLCHFELWHMHTDISEFACILCASCILNSFDYVSGILKFNIMRHRHLVSSQYTTQSVISSGSQYLSSIEACADACLAQTTSCNSFEAETLNDTTVMCRFFYLSAACLAVNGAGLVTKANTSFYSRITPAAGGCDGTMFQMVCIHYFCHINLLNSIA